MIIILNGEMRKPTAIVAYSRGIISPCAKYEAPKNIPIQI